MARRMTEANSTTENAAELHLRKKQENDETLRMVQERHRLNKQRLAEQEERKQTEQRQTMQKGKQSGRANQTLQALFAQLSPTPRGPVLGQPKPPIRAVDDTSTWPQHPQHSDRPGDDRLQAKLATQLQAHPSKPILIPPCSAAATVSKRRAVYDTAASSSQNRQAASVTAPPAASALNRTNAAAKRKAVINEDQTVEEDGNKRVREQKTNASERGAAVTGPFARELRGESRERRNGTAQRKWTEQRNGLASQAAEEIDDVPELAEALAMLSKPNTAALHAVSPERPTAKRQWEKTEVAELSTRTSWTHRRQRHQRSSNRASH